MPRGRPRKAVSAPAPALVRTGPTHEDIASCYLLDFGKYVMQGAWTPSWHHEVLVDTLEKVERGEILRLIVQMPPRHGKSTLISQLFPAWYLGRHPDREVVVASYAQRIASGWGRKVRNLVDGELFQKVFPTVHMADDSKSNSLFHVKDKLSPAADGSLYVVGMGGALTSRGAHVLVIDDPTKDAQEADSEAIKERNQDWFREVAYSRLAPTVGAIIILMTRWRTDDMAGWVQQEFPEQNWHVLSMPCVAEKDEEWELPGGKYVRRTPGDPLWPNRWSPQEINNFKLVGGARGWNAQYQQRPLPAEGNLCKATWFRRYPNNPVFISDVLKSAKRIVQSWDTAQKEKEVNDPSVCTTWAETESGYYLLDLFVGRLVYPDLKRAFLSQAAKWVPHAILIEDKASGTSLIQDLRAETRLPILKIEPDGNKLIRWQRVTPSIEAGQVYLPDKADWLLDFETELTSFPLASHDDQVDSTSQFLNWVRESLSPEAHSRMIQGASALARALSHQEMRAPPRLTDGGVGWGGGRLPSW